MTDYFTPRKAAIAGTAALILVLLVGWFAFVSPQRSQAAQLDDDIGEARTKLALAEALLRGTDERTADLVRLTAAMPAEVRMSSILRQLSTTAAQANVRINSISPQAATPVGRTTRSRSRSRSRVATSTSPASCASCRAERSSSPTR